MDVTIGADPEVFLTDENGEFVSAYGLFPGTKREPYKVPHGAIQVDGVALEFNIDPSSTSEEFEHNIHSVLSTMNGMVKDVSNKLSIRFTPWAHFTNEKFAELPDEAKVLGCDPDYHIVNTGLCNDPEAKIVGGPATLQTMPYRTAAGHIHLGWTKDENVSDPDHLADCTVLSAYFMKSGIFSAKTSDEQRRMQYYGGSGAFRPKPYGVELRSPSNLWVQTKSSRLKMFKEVKHVWDMFVEQSVN